MRRMIGGAETAILTLADSGQPGGPNSKMNFASPRSNNTPQKFIGFQASFDGIKTLVTNYQQNARPNKKDLKMTASQLFDVYANATPQARGKLDTCVPLNGFVEELGEAVKLTPENAKIFFNSLVNLITEMVPSVAAPTATEQAETAITGTGRGCGCCSSCKTCGGNKPDDKKPEQPKQPEPPKTEGTPSAMSPATSEELKKGAPTGNVVANALAWLKMKKESMGKIPATPAPKDNDQKNPSTPAPKEPEQILKPTSVPMEKTGSGKKMLGKMPAAAERKLLGLTAAQHKKLLSSAKKVHGGAKRKKILPGRVYRDDSDSGTSSDSDEEMAKLAMRRGRK